MWNCQLDVDSYGHVVPKILPPNTPRSWAKTKGFTKKMKKVLYNKIIVGQSYGINRSWKVIRNTVNLQITQDKEAVRHHVAHFLRLPVRTRVGLGGPLPPQRVWLPEGAQDEGMLLLTFSLLEKHYSSWGVPEWNCEWSGGVNSMSWMSYVPLSYNNGRNKLHCLTRGSNESLCQVQSWKCFPSTYREWLRKCLQPFL